MEEEAAIDREMLVTLKEVMEDEFQTLLETFITDAVLRLDLIKEALVNGDTDMLRSAAHSLKGSSSNIGAPKLCRLAAQMEEKGLTQQVVDAEYLLEAIEQEYQRVAAALNAL